MTLAGLVTLVSVIRWLSVTGVTCADDGVTLNGRFLASSRQLRSAIWFGAMHGAYR
jgi:hypothetical protein